MKSSNGIQYLAVIMMMFPLSALSGQQIEIDSVKGSSADAISITYARDDGVQINSTGGDGFYVNNAGLDGFIVSNAGGDGFKVYNAVGDGFEVTNAGDNGVKIFRAENDGIHVRSAGGYSMNIQGSKSTSGTISGHIAQIYNTSTGISPDVLALKVGTTSDLGGGVNFLTFYDGNEDGMGAIEGNGSGGVTFKSGSADFAEYLPIENNDTKYFPGDIVAIQDGHISLNTDDAQQLMVITEQPIILGNDQIDTDNFEKVSFVGQVPIKVRGSVQAGDWIISAGKHDGTGIARSSDKIQIHDQIVGLALQSSTNPTVKRINTIVGLDHSQALKDHILSDMQSTIREQQNEIVEFKSDISELKKEMNLLKELLQNKG